MKLNAGGGEVHLFSATKRTGIEDVACLLWDWTHMAPAPESLKEPRAQNP
jgi:GTP-binding protein